MSNLIIPTPLAGVSPDGVEWDFLDIETPGGCDRYDWCDGHCKRRSHYLGGLHSRQVASGARTEDLALIEVGVGQWKANPEIGIRDTGSCFAVNRDGSPVVGIFTYPADLDDTKRVKLKVPDAEALAEALRIVGHVQFAGALDNAVTLARRLEESKR